MRRNHLRPLLGAAALPAVLFLAGGCTKTKLWHTARFEPQNENSVTRAAPADAVYKVKWFDPRAEELQTVAGTERVLFKGQRVGFARDEEGRLLALAGEEQFALERLNRRAEYCVWVGKEKRDTHFARGMKTTARLVATGGLVAAAVALGVTGAVLDADDGDCGDGGALIDLSGGDHDSGRHHRHHKHKKRNLDGGKAQAPAPTAP